MFPDSKTNKQILTENQTGSAKYKRLETAVFAGAGHYIVEEGAVLVEYKLSQLVK
jgi:hypothetical protein